MDKILPMGGDIDIVTIGGCICTQTLPNTVLLSLTQPTRVFFSSSACLFLGRPLFLSVSQHPCLSCPLLSSLGLVTALFGAAGTLLNVSKRAQNQGKVSQVSHHVSALMYLPHVPYFSLRDTISTLGRR